MPQLEHTSPMEAGDGSTPSTLLGILREWLEANKPKPKKKKKPKLKLKPKLRNVKNKLKNLSKVVKNPKVKPKKPLGYPKPLGYNEKYIKKEKVYCNAIGKLKGETDEQIRRYEAVSNDSNRTAYKYQGINTLRFLKDDQSLHDLVNVPSRGCFADSVIYTREKASFFKGKDCAIHFFAHGIGRSASTGRMAQGVPPGQPIIGFAMRDAVASKIRENGRGYYLWRNLMAMKPKERKKALQTYIESSVLMTENRLGCRINKFIISCHSGGGRLCKEIVRHLGFSIKMPDGREIPIAGINGCDSQYEGNEDGCYSYLGHEMQKQTLEAIGPNVNSELKKALDNYKKKPSALHKLAVIAEVRKVAEKSTLDTIKDYVLVNLYKGNKAKIEDIFNSNPPRKIFDHFRNYPPEIALHMLANPGLKHTPSIRDRLDFVLLNKGNKSIKSSMIARVMIEGMDKMTSLIAEKALDGSLKDFKFPKYYASIEDNGWRHQARWNRFMLARSGKNGLIANNIADRYSDAQLKKKGIKKPSKHRHWIAYSAYIKEAVQHMMS